MEFPKHDEELIKALEMLKDALLKKNQFEQRAVHPDELLIAQKEEIYKFDLDF